MLDPNRLRVLQQVEQSQTLTAAASALFLTPSAISQQIKQLSRELGVPLLQREGRAVRLTAAARALIDYVEQTTEEWERTVGRLAQRDAPMVGQLKLCGFATSVASLLAPAAGLSRRSHVDLDVRVEEAGTQDCLERLLNKATDVAVIAAPGTPALDDPQFEQHPLLEDLQDLAVPADHPLASRESVRLHEVAREVWIAPQKDQRQLISVTCAGVGFSPRFEHQADDWRAVLALVEQGMGVCLLPRLASAEQARGVRLVPIPAGEAPVRHAVTCIRRGSGDQILVNHGLAVIREATDVYLESGRRTV